MYADYIHTECGTQYMCVSSVSTSTLNCVVLSILQRDDHSDELNSLVRSVLKGMSVNGHVQHLKFECLNSSLRLHGRCMVLLLLC